MVNRKLQNPCLTGKWAFTPEKGGRGLEVKLAEAEEALIRVLPKEPGRTAPEPPVLLYGRLRRPAERARNLSIFKSREL